MLSKLAIVDDYDLSSVRFIISAAASLSSDVLGKIMNKFGWNVIQALGLTECIVSHVSPLGENKCNGQTGSVGILMPFIEAKVTPSIFHFHAIKIHLMTRTYCAFLQIMDQETLKTTLVGAGKVGELCLRSPMVMKGYQGNPSATAEAIDSNGWLHTGDLAYHDEDGWFFIVGRLKELIKFKGNQVNHHISPLKQKLKKRNTTVLINIKLGCTH